MKKKLFLIALVVCLVLTSCVSGKTGLYSSGVTTNLPEKDYEILGPVELQGTITNVLGFFQWGGKGYGDLMKEAKALYPEADAVIDVYEDVSKSMIMLVYNTYTRTYYGTAIKYK